VTCVRDVAPDI